MLKEPNNNVKKIGIIEICIFFLFIIISIFFYPAILHPNTQISGQGGGDDYGTIYNFWWNKYSKDNNLNLYNNQLLNYPYGNNFYQNLQPFWNFIINNILLNFCSDICSYNIINWISFPLSAIAMYFLAFYLTKNRFISLLAGLMYAFTPYHFIRTTGHIFLAQIEWIPLYVLYLLKTFNNPNYKNSILAGSFLALVFLSDPYYALFVVFFTIMFWIIKLFFGYKQAVLKYFFIITVLAFSLSAIFYLPAYFQSKKTSNLVAPRATEELYRWGLNQVKYYFIPSQYNYLLGNFWNKIFYKNQGMPDFEWLVYLGIPAIIFAIYCLYQCFKGKFEKDKKSIIVIFLALAIFSIIFSLRPPLSPTLWIHKILPVFRVYSRMFVFVDLSIIILAIYGLQYFLNVLANNKFLAKHFSSSQIKIFILAFIFLIISVDFLPSFETKNIGNVPEEYLWLKNQPQNTVIAEYPYTNRNFTPTQTYMFWQRIHQHPIINGQPEPDPTGKERIRLQIFDITNNSTPIALKKMGAKYIFLHKDYYNKPDLKDNPVLPEKILNITDFENINPNLKLVNVINQTYIYEIK
ncbi:MAG: hypothetical protein WC663_02940 [Patescibacteria group bacterium]